MPPNRPLVEMKSIHLQFDSTTVFEDFNLSLYEGDSLVMVGPSGSGKSSLLKLMAGLIKPQSGEISYRGKEVSTLSRKERAEQLSEMGMLFQQNALFDSLTVFQNLDFVLSEVHPKMAQVERKEEILPILEAVGLDHVLDLFPNEISGGMQKRLGIARAVVVKPRLIFYDDPTAGLDPITSRKIIQMILELQKSARGTIVTVTHDMMRAYQLAGRCMVCFHGDFIETGDADQTRDFQDPRVQQFINGAIEGPIGAL